VGMPRHHICMRLPDLGSTVQRKSLEDLATTKYWPFRPLTTENQMLVLRISCSYARAYKASYIYIWPVSEERYWRRSSGPAKLQTYRLLYLTARGRTVVAMWHALRRTDLATSWRAQTTERMCTGVHCAGFTGNSTRRPAGRPRHHAPFPLHNQHPLKMNASRTRCQRVLLLPSQAVSQQNASGPLP